MEDGGKRITGINLKNGEKKSYGMQGMRVEGLYYENGYLYIHARNYATGKEIFRLDAVSGEKEYLAEDFYWAYMENGYLYYVWNDHPSEDGELNLSVLNVETKQLETEVLTERSGAWLQTVGDDLVVDVDIYKNMEKEKAVYFRYRAGVLPLERLDRKEKRAESG